MKTRKIIIALASILLLSLATCKKDPQPIMECFDLSREDLTIGTTSASIVGTYNYSGAIDKINVYVSEDGVHSKEFAADINGKNFTVEMTELSPATHYQYNYSIDYGFSKPYVTDAKYFTTLNETPTVHTVDIINIDSTTVRVNCEVVSDGGISIMERGVCWNTYGNPNFDDEKLAYSEAGTGEYSCRISGLSPYTNYHVKAYAINSSGISYGEEIVFSTLSTGYTVAISVIPENGGTVTGGGVYYEGQNCIVVAQANNGFTFSHWSEDETQVSSEALYSFIVTGDRNLVAHFIQQHPDSYAVNVSTNNNEGGSVIGGGLFQYGQSCTLMAVSNNGYAFVNWTEDGVVVSTDAIYTFSVTCSRTLVANFVAQYIVNVSANPSDGGTVIGEGTYMEGDICTIKATADGRYIFVNWTENEIEVSTDSIYTFAVESNRTLVANFVATYTINVSSESSEGGIVSGGGIYLNGQTCTVQATANTGWGFLYWKVLDILRVSSDKDYSFTVTRDRNLFANFARQPQQGWHTYSNNVLYTCAKTDGWAYEYTVDLLSNCIGWNITKVSLYSDSQYIGGNYTCCIYVGGSNPEDGTMVSTITVEVPQGQNDWVDWELTAPVIVTGDDPIWIVWRANNAVSQYPIGCGEFDLNLVSQWAWVGSDWSYNSGIGPWMMRQWFSSQNGGRYF